MKRIDIPASRAYPVMIGAGLLREAGERISGVRKASAAVIVSDDHVFPLYGVSLAESLRASGLRVEAFVFPHGEQHKTVAVWKDLLEFLCSARITRSDLIVALGGGVVGDLAGFAASAYQRGIGYVQIPTSLLAMVDSSVGGKTAVDLDGGKNMVGSFYQPLLVLCDPDTLATLPEEEYRCGCAEIIKYGMIGDADFFASLARTPVREQYETVIAACVEMKRRYVMEDEFDTGLRMMLNFGHTFGHAAEICSGFSILHGQGVAVGMAVIARAACRRGILSAADRDALLELIRSYGLPTEARWPAEEMAAAARSDKKSTGDAVRLILPEKIGRCRIERVPSQDLLSWLRDGGVR